MARHCIREPRYVPPVQRIGEQPDLFGGPTLSHVAERKGPPKGWQRQLQKWGRCTVIADLEAAPPSVIDPPPSPSPVFLVACVAAKLDRPAPARDLYASPWFQKARAYVERQGGAWFILSAKHGLIAPETVIAPYDETLGVGACNHDGVCSQTARFPAHAICHWRVASCSNYLPVCSPSSGAACKRGVVLTLPARGFSKPVAGRRFCEAGFQNSSDKRRAAEMRCGHGPPARSSERKVFANSGWRIKRAQIYVYD